MNVVISGSLEIVRQEMIIVPVSNTAIIEGRGFAEIVSKHNFINTEYFNRCRCGVRPGEVQFFDVDNCIIALAYILRVGAAQDAIELCAGKIKERIDGSDIKSVVVYCYQSIRDFSQTVDLLERTLDKCHVDVWVL